MDDARNAPLARFLARFAVSEREAVEKDVADLRRLSPEQTWPVVHAVLQATGWPLSAQPDPIAVALERDPPHPTFELVMKRLRAGYRRP